jgi:hypothetical protein
LNKRDVTFCDDGALARAIKTHDLKKLQWMTERGFPLNLNVKDADGMCYEAVDMAEAFGTPEVVKFVKELSGLPFYSILLLDATLTLLCSKRAPKTDSDNPLRWQGRGNHHPQLL